MYFPQHSDQAPAKERENQSLQHLLQGGEMSKWGLANAVTRTAEDASEYDRATEMEALGWNIVKMPEREWSSLIAKS